MKMFLTLLAALLPLTGCLAQNQQLVNSTAQEENSSREQSSLMDSADVDLKSPGLSNGVKEVPDPYVWDFGSINKDEIVKHDFEIKNNLDKILTIKDISTSCGCTASSAKKKNLAPGESTQITVEFNSKGYQGQTAQFVYVNTNDPANPILKYTIKVFVQ